MMLYALFTLEAFVFFVAYILYELTGCLGGSVAFGLVLGGAVFVNWYLCATATTARHETTGEGEVGQ